MEIDIDSIFASKQKIKTTPKGKKEEKKTFAD